MDKMVELEDEIKLLESMDGKEIVTTQVINMDEITKIVEEKVKERLMRVSSQSWG